MDVWQQQPEVVSGLRCCERLRPVAAQLPPFSLHRHPLPPMASHTLSPSLFLFSSLCFPPLLLICLNLSTERPPASLHHLTLSLPPSPLHVPYHYTPPHTHTPTRPTTMLVQCCCLSLSNNCTPDRAQSVLLQTHPGKHTSTRAHAQARMLTRPHAHAHGV